MGSHGAIQFFFLLSLMMMSAYAHAGIGIANVGPVSPVQDVSSVSIMRPIEEVVEPDDELFLSVNQEAGRDIKGSYMGYPDVFGGLQEFLIICAILLGVILLIVILVLVA